MKRIHFIALGGAIMHQLALAIQRQGALVSGSDDLIRDPARSALEAAGLLPAEEGWFPERITEDMDAVILGMHARADNPELIRARELNIPIFSFPQWISRISRDKTRVVVAGSHGKTTVTSMIMHILKARGLEFDYLVGAGVPGFDHSVRISQAPLIILEGDEYLSSCEDPRPKMHWYHPHIAVLTGIAWDHINVFPDYESYFAPFREFISMLKPGSTLFYFGEDEEIRRAITESGTPAATRPYGLPDYRLEGGRMMRIHQGKSFPLSVMGKHNLANAEVAVSVAMALGVDQESAWSALEDFQGAARRMEKWIEEPGFLGIRDFAHAPSKLRASLAAAREAYPDHFVLACFEMHTFSSLNPEFIPQYAGALDRADKALVFFSPRAVAHKGLPALDPEFVARSIQLPRDQIYVDKQELIEAIKQVVAALDRPLCLLVMSSGSFEGIDWNNVSSQLKPLIPSYG